MNYFQKKKLFLMSIVNKVKGFIRTVTGSPPINLEDCIDNKSIINYQIHGNSIQNGESSPENPVEIVSVGEKTYNLFNPKVMFNNINKVMGLEITYNNDGSFNLIGTTNNSYFFVYNSVVFPVSAGETFTLSVTYECDKNPVFGMVFCNGVTTSTQIIATNGNNASETTTKDTANLGFRISGVTANTYYEIRNICFHFERGDTATEYEPYGYKIPVTASGKNLFDYSVLSSIYSGNSNSSHTPTEDGCIKCTRTIASYSNSIVVYIPLKAGTYSIKVELVDVVGYKPTNVAAFGLRDSMKFTNGSTVGYNGNIRHFTITEKTSVGFNLYSCDAEADRAVGNSCTWKVIITPGQVSNLEWEPYIEPKTTNIYLNEPLANESYIDFKKQKLVTEINGIITEESVKLPDLPTFKGKTTIFTVDTEVQPTEMSVTYYSNMKGE